MALKQFTIDFEKLSTDSSMRLSSPFRLPIIKYKYDKLTNFLSFFESGNRPKGGIESQNKEGAISLGGEQINIDGSVNLSKIYYVPLEFYERSKRGKVKNSDILICKDGALTGKACLVDLNIFPSKKVMVNEHVYIFRTKKGINQKLLFYLIRNNLFQSQVRDLAYRKKAQPGLNTKHLEKIKIPLIPKLVQEQIINQIELIENEITELKSQIKDLQNIINGVFAEELGFNINEVYSVEQRKYFFVSKHLTYRNSNIRSSARFHKITPIQDVLYKNYPFIKKLGRYVISIKNGWSPSCRENDSLNYVFGLNSITTKSVISYDNLKVSNERRENIEDYFSKEGDFFVSRGNTVDLVGLACVVENISKDKNIIFPDLFIRIGINEDKLNKKYLAYLFNSIIGRLYFKYTAKGKNQTMVKISSDEINNFYLPLPPLERQEKIVYKIKSKIDKQGKIRQKIYNERNKIDDIMINAIIYY